MIIYDWRCRICNGEATRMEYQHEAVECVECQVAMVRVYGFYHRKAFEPHYNASIGKYVKTEVDFADKLKQESEKQWLERGIETRLVPIDPRDVTKTGANAEGLEATFKQERDAGKTEAKKLIL